MDINFLRELSKQKQSPESDKFKAILDKSKTEELSLEEINLLINCIYSENFNYYREFLLDISTQQRFKAFGNKVIAMAPVEISNHCSSDCYFCGWRASNWAMPRMSISEDLVLEQVNYLLDKGIYSIEYVGGDDFNFVRKLLPSLIPETKKLFKEKGVEGRIYICTMALTVAQYSELKALGADSMIVWQETYDPLIYRKMITKGPKAHGIQDDWRIQQNGNGYEFRYLSQERALKAGMQVALGSMLKLNDNLNYEILATIQHARSLIKGYPINHNYPIVIGMPLWNSIPTSVTDNLPKEKEYIAPIFTYIAAIYFLSLPAEKVWIFPNCRVSLKDQIEAVKAAGVFTSTEVKLGPGGYLPALLRKNAEDEKYISYIKGKIEKNLGIKYNTLQELERKLDLGEQFLHHYDTHEAYVKALEERGLEVQEAVSVKPQSEIEE
jgi:hypothetical protein